jgi:hypothetical protein
MNLDQDQATKSGNPDLEKLVRLQDMDAVIGQLTAMIEVTIPGQIKELEDHFVKDQAILKKYDEETAAYTKRKRELEAEVEDNQNKIAKAKHKLNDVKTNVEYRAIVKETENFGERINKIDDEQLALMERMEERSGLRPAILKQVEEDKAKLNKLKAEKEIEQKGLKEKLAGALAERGGIVSGVSPDILANYEKVRGQRGGVGAARVREGSCTACYQIIPPQLFYHIRTSDGIYQCPHCSRYLYYIPEPKVEEAQTAGSGRKKKE